MSSIEPMVASRRSLSSSEETYLVTQVDRSCPLCGEPLFYEKNGRMYKQYEIAHIYPLNPTPAERSLLAAEERLHEDVNHVDNLIPLCWPCHGRFDKPRTVNEYRELVGIKKERNAYSRQQQIQRQYRVEEEIERIIESLYSSEHVDGPELQLDPKDLARKLDDSMSKLTQRKVRSNVSQYFLFVRDKFLELERESPNTLDLIASQIRAFYFAQKKLGLTQQDIFSNVVGWLVTSTRGSSRDAAEVVASFFVQNCEIFE